MDILFTVMGFILVYLSSLMTTNEFFKAGCGQIIVLIIGFLMAFIGIIGLAISFSNFFILLIFVLIIFIFFVYWGKK
jgi:hypothetical protein